MEVDDIQHSNINDEDDFLDCSSFVKTEMADEDEDCDFQAKIDTTGDAAQMDESSLMVSIKDPINFSAQKESAEPFNGVSNEIKIDNFPEGLTQYERVSGYNTVFVKTEVKNDEEEANNCNDITENYSYPLDLVKTENMIEGSSLVNPKALLNGNEIDNDPLTDEYAIKDDIQTGQKQKSGNTGSVESSKIGEKLFNCSRCPFTTVHKNILRNHHLIHRGEKPLTCDFCSYSTCKSSVLKKHISSHTGEKPFACHLCSCKAVSSSYLKKHLLTHSGEKPFACDLCPYRSNQSSNLNRHLLIHTGEKRFSCTLCSYKSHQSSHIRIHRLTHTGEKPLSCGWCPYKSVHSANLKRHVLTHTGEKHLSCDSCSYKSVHSSNLKRHKLIHRGK